VNLRQMRDTLPGPTFHFLPSSEQYGAECAARGAVPKVIYKADETRRGFITSMLAPVNSRQEPRFGARQAFVFMALAVGTMALMRLLLAR
jgi:hypothetical protein